MFSISHKPHSKTFLYITNATKIQCLQLLNSAMSRRSRGKDNHLVAENEVDIWLGGARPGLFFSKQLAADPKKIVAALLPKNQLNTVGVSVEVE